MQELALDKAGFSGKPQKKFGSLDRRYSRGFTGQSLHPNPNWCFDWDWWD